VLIPSFSFMASPNISFPRGNHDIACVQIKILIINFRGYCIGCNMFYLNQSFRISGLKCDKYIYIYIYIYMRNVRIYYNVILGSLYADPVFFFLIKIRKINQAVIFFLLKTMSYFHRMTSKEY
jgi:hypothetical protein